MFFSRALYRLSALVPRNTFLSLLPTPFSHYAPALTTELPFRTSPATAWSPSKAVLPTSFTATTSLLSLPLLLPPSPLPSPSCYAVTVVLTLVKTPPPRSPLSRRCALPGFLLSLPSYSALALTLVPLGPPPRAATSPPILNLSALPSPRVRSSLGTVPPPTPSSSTPRSASPPAAEVPIYSLRCSDGPHTTMPTPTPSTAHSSSCCHSDAQLRRPVAL